MGKKILIVDDDRDILLGLNARLRASGFEPVVAADGVEAMKMAHQEVPDLIVLDLGLPAGDGFVTLERLRSQAKLAGIPVIVLSARSAQTNEKKALDAGAFAYFQKPADDDQLLGTISRALRETSQE